MCTSRPGKNGRQRSSDPLRSVPSLFHTLPPSCAVFLNTWVRGAYTIGALTNPALVKRVREFAQGATVRALERVCTGMLLLVQCAASLVDMHESMSALLASLSVVQGEAL